MAIKKQSTRKKAKKGQVGVEKSSADGFVSPMDLRSQKAQDAQLREKLKSWDDMFRGFDALMEGIKKEPHPIAVFNALFFMYAFICSLKNNEEWEFERVKEAMIQALVWNPEEIMGFSLTALPTDPVEREQMLEFMMQQPEGPMN